MPKYVGKGPNFYLVTCELMLSPGASKEEKIKFHENFCNRCGFYRDAATRAEKAIKEKRKFAKLVCVHPANTATLEKWKQHIR
ncbi:hypothetical protein ES702_01411 [subsurface metagenome]